MSIEYIENGQKKTLNQPEGLDLGKSDNIAKFINLDTDSRYKSLQNPDIMLTGEEFLQELGNLVTEGFLIDNNSRALWEQNRAEELKLFLSYLPKKTYPWPDASNVNVPFITIAAIQFQARAFDALIPSKDIVNVTYTGDEDIERSERVKKFMNWQLLYKMPDFEEDMDKSLIQLPLMGSCFRKTFYDPIIGTNQSTYISAIDLVVNYKAKKLESARKTQIIQMSLNDIQKRINKGVFLPFTFSKHSSSSTDIPTSKIRESYEQVFGISQVDDDNNILDNERVILEQHYDYDIDGDGIAEPYIITVDYNTRKILRIVSRGYVDSLGEKKTFEHFTHYTFFPNPEGFYGIGLGILLRGLNDAANTILNEIIDAGALANLQGGFVSKRSGVGKGPLKFSQGEFKELDFVFTDDIRKAIYNFEFKGPSPTLFTALGLLFEYSKLVSSISETSLGQMPSSDTPAYTILALIEEGKKVYSAIHKRTHRAFKKELQKLYILNSLHLKHIEYFKVLGDNNIPTNVSAATGKADFMGITDIIPISDPSITSKSETVVKAREFYNDVLKNPVTASDIQVIYRASLDYYKALGIPNVEEIIKEPGPPLDVDPVTENGNILKEGSVNVLPEQDHMHHITVHDELLTGPFAEELTPTGKKLLERHRQEHISALYIQTQQSESQSQPQGIPNV